MPGTGMSQIWHATVCAIPHGCCLYTRCGHCECLASDVPCHHVSALLHEAPAPRVLVLCLAELPAQDGRARQCCIPVFVLTLIYPTFSLAAIFNVLGLPVTQCPLGLGSEGLPLGIQLVAASYNDHLTLAVARYLEKAFGGWVLPGEL